MISVDDLVAKVKSSEIEHVVLTGGEPMLFDPIVDLATELKALGHVITIETAGTIYRDLPCDLMSISPKLANSTPVNEPTWKNRHDEARLNFDSLQQLIDRYHYQLKFVVNPDTGGDLTEIEGILERLTGVIPSNVLLMPEGTDSDNLHRRARLLVEPVMKRNWRLTQRLHIDLFGNTKGT